jgi:ATP-dependent helicase/nuclease subunit A
MRLMDQARRYEARSSATSFRGFVDELELRAERDEASETPLVEEGTEGVRIMTVHRAKGLEFPVVILADITCKETAAEPTRYVDPQNRLCALRVAGCAPRELLDHLDEERRRDEEEAIRLLYVAATRARDLLVVPAVGDAEQPGWLARLAPAIYPPAANRRAPLSRNPPGCPEFGQDSVLVRPQRAPGPAKSVAPGMHAPARGEHRVVWWDPSRLILDVGEAMGLRQSKLLEADESATASNAGEAMHAQWRADRDAAIADGAAPSFRVATATALARAQTEKLQPPAGTIRIEEMRRPAARPHSRRFGTLVHETLLRTPLDAPRARVARLAAGFGRSLGATGEEAAAAVDAVMSALGAPVIRAAAQSGEVRREFPIVTRMDDGTSVDGIADLVFVAGAGPGARWVVVDFKTDLDLASRLDEYRAQIGLYLRGLADATGRPAEGVILRV